MKEICKCTCHISPLFHHEGKCCENSGKIYLDDNGNVLEKLYKELQKDSPKICPCCGGSGISNETC